MRKPICCPICQSGLAHMSKTFQNKHIKLCRELGPNYDGNLNEPCEQCGEDEPMTKPILELADRLMLGDIFKGEQYEQIITACNEYEELIQQVKQMEAINLYADGLKNLNDELVEALENLLELCGSLEYDGDSACVQRQQEIIQAKQTLSKAGKNG